MSEKPNNQFRKLTAKETAFVQHYLIHLNAKKAALLAGYSPHTAKEIGTENLSKPPIAYLIYQEFDRRAKKANITQDRVLQELKRVAFSNMSDYARWDGNTVGLRDCDDLTRDKTAAIQEISETVTAAGGSTKLKMYDKLRALEMLGKFLSMWGEPSQTPEAPIAPSEEKYPSMTKEQAEELLKKAKSQ